jgi:hypothetical protein
MTRKNRNSGSAVRSLAALAVFFASSAAYTQEAAQDKAISAPIPPQASVPVTAQPNTHADFRQEKPSEDARAIADWVVDSGDNGHKPFVIVDKKAAHVFAFDAEGHLRGAAPALLGIALGDHSVPGVGDRELSAIRLQDRTTPAGRFEASLGRNYKGKEILWVDYDAAISMHPVINTVPKERRPHRLATPTPLDNRISFGCINVPIPFFGQVISPSFTGTSGIVYVLPDVLPLRKVFAAFAAEHDAHSKAKAPQPPKETPPAK